MWKPPKSVPFWYEIAKIYLIWGHFSRKTEWTAYQFGK